MINFVYIGFLRSALCLAIGFVVLFFGNTGCRKASPEWNSDWTIPLINAQLGIADIDFEDHLQEDSSGVAELVLRKSLYNISLDSLLLIPDTIRTRTFTIDSLALYDARTVFPLSLGEICRQAGPVGLLIILQNGSKVPIGAIPTFSAPPVPLSADTIFSSMTLEKGNMELSFTNGLPIDITDVKFELRNSSTKEIVVSGIFPLIRSNTRESQVFSLDGKTVEGKLEAQLTGFSSPGSGGQAVLIDTSNAIITEIRVFNLNPITATAIWPAQNLVNQQQDFNIRGLDVFLKEALVKSGVIRFRMKSSIQDSVRFLYTLPAATKNGQIFTIRKVLPPAPIGGFSEFSNDYDFSGYLLDMSGENKDTFNAAYNTYLIQIDSTGEKKTFSKSDQFIMELGFVNIKPSYVRGFLASDTFQIINEEIEFETFKELSGRIDFESAKLDIQIANQIGAEALVRIPKLSASNSATMEQVDFVGELTQKSFSIQRASDQMGMLPITPSILQVNVDPLNSNITKLVSILPDQMTYSLDVITNPNGNQSNYQDFVYDGKLLDLDLNLSIPLHLKASEVAFSKILDLDLSGYDFDEIISAKFNFIFLNEFPFDCNIGVDLLQDDGVFIQTLQLSNPTIVAGKADSNGKVQFPVETIITLDVDKNLLYLLQSSKKLRLSATINTRPMNDAVKIYSDYILGMKLTGRFNYLNK